MSGKSSAAYGLMEGLMSEAAAAADLVAFLRDVDDDDPDVIEDGIEGETNLKEALSMAYAQMVEAAAHAEALKAIISKTQARKKRLEDRARFTRHAIMMAVARAAGDDPDEEKFPFTITLPEATMVVSETLPKINVTDEALLPSKFFVTPEPKLDKAALQAHVDENPDDLPPGVEMTLPGVSMRIWAN